MKEKGRGVMNREKADPLFEPPVANVAEEEATETFHEMQAEIDRLLLAHSSFGAFTGTVPGTRIRRLTFTLPVKTLAELFAAMVTGEGGLNIQTERPIILSVCFQYICWGFSA